MTDVTHLFGEDQKYRETVTADFMDVNRARADTDPSFIGVIRSVIMLFGILLIVPTFGKSFCGPIYSYRNRSSAAYFQVS